MSECKLCNHSVVVVAILLGGIITIVAALALTTLSQVKMQHLHFLFKGTPCFSIIQMICDAVPYCTMQK